MSEWIPWLVIPVASIVGFYFGMAIGMRYQAYREKRNRTILWNPPPKYDSWKKTRVSPKTSPRGASQSSP